MIMEKTQIKPLFANAIVLPYKENPYLDKVSETGLVYNDTLIDNTDSGETESMDIGIGCGKVIDAGTMCKYIKPGDDVFYNVAMCRPVPFKRTGFLLCNENNILAVMNDDLEERFKQIQ